MGNRRRVRPFREVKDVSLGTTGAISDPGTTANVSCLLTGLSSLLHIGFHLAFFPADGKRPADADFAGSTFAIFGWTADERGQRVQLDSEAVSGATPLQAPGGWAGRTDLDQLELRATIDALGTAGDWRAIAVIEPADGAMCEEIFAALAAEVDLTPGHRPPQVLNGVP